MASFANVMSDMLGTVITEVVVGMGPCGELRYPAYQEEQGWRFPGVRTLACSNPCEPLQPQHHGHALVAHVAL